MADKKPLNEGYTPIDKGSNQPTKQPPGSRGYAQDGWTPTKSSGKPPAPPPKKP